MGCWCAFTLQACRRCIALKSFGVHIILLFTSLTAIWFSGCKSSHICPAYQSAFYLDKKIADEEFSYFDKDSLPKMEETVRKSDVLLVIRLGKKRIDKRMAVVPMITIFPEQADSALAMADSLGADSLSTELDPNAEPTDGEPTETDSLGLEKEKKPTGDEEFPSEDIPKEEPEAPKKKKLDPKDPELSDPTLKAEFEESFDEAPKEEDFEEPPPVEPEVPKKKSKKKAKEKPGKEPKKKPEPEKPKEEEPEPAPADDKF